MNPKDKKKLAGIIGKIKKLDDGLNELLQSEQQILSNRDAEVNPDAEDKEVIEADVQCLTEMIDDLAKIGQTLTDHFELE